MQLCAGSPNHSNQTRKSSKRHPNWKGRGKTIPNLRWHDSTYRKSKRIHLQLNSAKLQGTRLTLKNPLCFYTPAQPKNWCFWTVVLGKTLESPLDCKEIQPVPSEGDQPWDFFARNDAKAETPVLWPPHAKVDSLEKTLMLGGIGGRRRRGWQRMRWLDGITD